MKKKYISLMAAALLMILPAAAAGATDSAEVNGAVHLGVRGVDDQDNSAKFQEYRDLDDGFFGDVLLDVYKDSYYMELEGDNLGLDDQNYTIKGGSYNRFKYKLFYDELPHNLSFDAKTFLSGTGSDNLSYSGAAPPPESDWNTFDYAIDRKSYGGRFELSLGTPFFFSVGADKLETDGLKPLASGSFSGIAEMPEPVDYTTDNITMKGGYRSRDLIVTVSGLISSFDNENLSLKWRNPFTGAAELNSLPPENDYRKIKGMLAWKHLPALSTFTVSSSYAKLENEYTVNDLDMTAPTGLNRSEFEGDVSYTDFSTALSSRPMAGLDTRLYYKYRDRENDSSLIESVAGSNEDYLFDYSRNNAGLDIGYRLPFSSRIRAGYEYLDIERTNRPDVESNTDNSAYVELKNSSLEMLTAKVRYRHLERDSDQDFDLAGLTATDSAYIVQFVDRYDYTDKSRDEVKLTLELYPVDSLDLGLEYTYAINDYDDVVLGRTEDRQHAVYADFSWRHATHLTLNGFAGYETSKAEATRYATRSGSGTPAQTSDPTVDDGNPDSYLWDQDLDDDFWTYGISASMPLMAEKLRLILSWEYQKSDGESTFSSQGTTGLEDIEDSDDYTKKLLEAKAVYLLDDKIDVTLGYAFEKYEYDDLQYEGYDYIASGSYLSGAYLDHDYEANIGYLLVGYTF